MTIQYSTKTLRRIYTCIYSAGNMLPDYFLKRNQDPWKKLQGNMQEVLSERKLESIGMDDAADF